ncbi:hypothetical protein [Streptomyces cacaoi]|uniref:hypothetical protein n=1 Tax=Streptomyces cacaoi TaxID=1898 RepID=UPI000A38AB44|nr:hypothetical protein [Streptomyces cacaoi]
MVAAVVVVALAVGGTLLAVSGGDDDKKDDKASSGTSEPSPGDDATDDSDGGTPSDEPSESADASDTEYELDFPKTLQHGEYTLAQDLSDQVDTSSNPDEKAHMGSYKKGSDATQRLLYAGATGQDFGDPDMSKDQMMKGMETSPSMTIAVKRRDITPAGADDPLTCEVLLKKQSGRKLTIPVCAWSNPGTAAYVAEDSLKTYSVKPQDVDLEDFADRVNGIRDEVRKPVG